MGMDEDAEPFRMANGDTWHFAIDEAAGLHIITIKTAEGEVRARLTMASDQLGEFAGAMGEVYAQAADITPEKIIEGGQPDQGD